MTKTSSVSPSPAEEIKEKSLGLRGTLETELRNPLTGAIPTEDQIVIKHHGIYLQDDRDRREIREEKKLERDYRFMARLRLPGGDITPEQWLGICKVIDQNGNGVVKITTRQTVQIHGVIKSRIKPTLQEFYKLGIDTIAACGDVNRNVAANSNPGSSSFEEEAHAFATRISEFLLPKTRAWYEIWLGKEKITAGLEENIQAEVDPLYQTHYLPRKFKIGIAVPPRNDTDVLTNDLALIAIEKNQKLVGFNIAAGGGMGTTHGNPDTYPRLATLLGYAPKQEVLEVIWQIVAVQRDFGNRSDRTQARLKYTIDRMGVEAFVQEITRRLKKPLQPAFPTEFTERRDRHVWQKDNQGLWYSTLYVENGCVKDTSEYKIKTALFEIAKTRKCQFRFTSNQNIVLVGVSEKDKPLLQDLLDLYGIDIEGFSPVRMEALACVALNTCPLALAEGQRYLPALITHIEVLLKKYHLYEQPISLRMTGCPNGCARPHTAEIGLIGRSLGHYNLHLGGDSLGLRLNTLYAENLDEEGILKTLEPLFAAYAENRETGEGFGDFLCRKKFIQENTVSERTKTGESL